MQAPFGTETSAIETTDTRARESTFKAAEENGLRLAIRGRLAAIALIGTAVVMTRDSGRTGDFLLMFGVFALIGLAHYAVIGTRWDRAWIKYAMVALDVSVICYALSVGRLHESADIPQYMVFRTDLFPFMFMFLAVSAFSFSPGLILFAGAAISIGWMTVFMVLTRDVVDPIEWSAVRRDLSAEQYLAIVLDQRFIASGSRLQESVVLFVTAALLSGVMYRARRTVLARLEAEQEREAVAQVFGQYVPAAVVNQLVEDRGSLDPVEREATVLFTDLQGFTALTERLGPSDTVAVLNEYFDAAAHIVAEHGGVVTQFQGDAVVATFNVPVEIANHASAALHAAEQICALTDSRDFLGVELVARTGVATGPLVAGSVGGAGRQTYTVHGDTVNLAARLEALNKELGTRIAIAEATHDAARDTFRFSKTAETTIRGQSEPAKVFTLDGTPGAVTPPRP